MSAKIIEFINRAVQVAKYASLPNSNPETVASMVADLEAEAEELKKRGCRCSALIASVMLFRRL